MRNAIDWRRIQKAILQRTRARGFAERVEKAMSQLFQLVEICGEFTKNRKMLVRIGNILLDQNPIIIAPCCPDYGHENGRYNFRGLNGSVPLLATKHIEFLKKVVKIIPKAKLILLVADLESEDEAIRKAVKKTKSEFDRLIRESLEAIREAIKKSCWNAELMTSMIPNLKEKEIEISKWIEKNEKFKSRLRIDTNSRSKMYWKINPSFSYEEKLKRTIRTAAQYLAFGELLSQKGCIICNHTTVNLSWYLQTEVGVLHNPVSVY